MKIHEMEQGSNEWFEIRKLKMTASNAQAIATAGVGLETYITNLVSEYLSSAEKEKFNNEHTERGHELEETARALYELEKGEKVEEVGFIELDEYIGCSPDGLIGKDGGLEIKCPSDSVYFKQIIENKIPSNYRWQVQMNLYITRRKWWDLVFYNPNFQKNMIIYRIFPNEDDFIKLGNGLEKGKEIINEYLNKYKKYEYQ